MKILVITQKVDKDDPVLGFFHGWLLEFAKHFEFITVICLEKGKYDLPGNVEVLSLGKEKGVNKLGYILNFYSYLWQKRANYSHIFVHMNQEYVLLAGDIWRLMGKKIYLWRNHAQGSFLTHLAAWLSHKVFYTSPSSYTARFNNSIQMPVGIDTEFFKPDPNVARKKNTVLMLGRLSPVKKVLEFIDWIKSADLEATIAGPILPRDKEYGRQVLEALTPKIKYVGPVNQEEALKLYRTHEIFVNKTPAGSMDKTILEAAACGMKLMVDNPDAKDIDVKAHSLRNLMDKLKEEIGE